MKRTTAIVIQTSLLLFANALHAQTAPQELIDGAKSGDPVKEWALGHYYLTATSDKKQAYYWIKKAADEGQMNAKIELSANFGSSGSTPFGDAEASGILKRAEEAKEIIVALAPDARLAMFAADNETPPIYVFYSPAKKRQVTVIDQSGSLMAGQSTASTINWPLPGQFIDLPQAIATARARGMRGDIKSAKLTVSKAKDKAPISVWLLTPVSNNGEFLSYFVDAADGRALELTDFSDGVDASDAQLQAARDAERAQAPNPTSGGSHMLPRNSILFPSPAQQYNRNRLGGPLSECAARPGASGCF